MSYFDTEFDAQLARAQRDYDNMTDDRTEYVDLTDEEADYIDTYNPDEYEPDVEWYEFDTDFYEEY